MLMSLEIDFEYIMFSLDISKKLVNWGSTLHLFITISGKQIDVRLNFFNKYWYYNGATRKSCTYIYFFILSVAFSDIFVDLQNLQQFTYLDLTWISGYVITLGVTNILQNFLTINTSNWIKNNGLWKLSLFWCLPMFFLELNIQFYETY